MHRISTICGHDRLPAWHKINFMDVRTYTITQRRLDEKLFCNRWCTIIDFQEKFEIQWCSPRLFNRQKIVVKVETKYFRAERQSAKTDDAEALHLDIVRKLASGMHPREVAKKLEMGIDERPTHYGAVLDDRYADSVKLQ